MRLVDLSFATVLGGAFGIMLLFVAAVAGTDYWGMSGMQRAISRVAAENSARSALVNQASQSVNDIAWASRLIPYQGGDEALSRQIEQYRGTFGSALSSLEGMKVSGAERGAIGEVKSALAELVRSAAALGELAKSGKQQEALALQQGETQQLALKAKERLAAFGKLEEGLAAGAVSESSSLFGNNQKIVGALLLVAILASMMIVRDLVKGTTEPLKEALQFANKLADGDLSARCGYDGKDETGLMVAAMNKMAEKLTTIVTDLRNISQSVSMAAVQLQGTAGEIASGMEQVALQTTTIATASEEMTSTSGDIAQNCQSAADTSNSANASAAISAEVVKESISCMGRIAERVSSTAASMESLGNRSNQIGEIIGTIEDIADQTNLLALNAAIEAARAGEQGRGFAVVADEVRALAERTTKATREIGGMIKAIQQETKAAVAAMDEGVAEVTLGNQASAKSSGALQEILDQIQQISSQVHQIATAAEEQTATTNNITSNIQQVTDIVTATARGAEDTASAAAQLASQSVSMQKLVQHFKVA